MIIISMCYVAKIRLNQCPASRLPLNLNWDRSPLLLIVEQDHQNMVVETLSAPPSFEHISTSMWQQTLEWRNKRSVGAQTVMRYPPEPPSFKLWPVFMCDDEDNNKWKHPPHSALHCGKAKQAIDLWQRVNDNKAQFQDNATSTMHCKPVWLELKNGEKMLYWAGNFLRLLGQADTQVMQAIEQDLMAIHPCFKVKR